MVYIFASEYAKATIKGPGNNRLFFPVLICEQFQDSVIKEVENRDPFKNAIYVRALFGRYFNLLFPVLAELQSSKITYYPNRNVLGRAFVDEMQATTKKYFDIQNPS